MQAIRETESLADFYLAVRRASERLCAPLKIEDYVPQPIADVSPPKWNIAHTTWFFEEMILKKFVSGYEEFSPDFGFLFNSYYNNVGKRTVRARRGDITRPTVEAVYEYRRFVDEKMLEFLKSDLSPEAVDLIALGLNHEQQHQELLLTDLKYTLSCNPLAPVYRENYFPEEASEIQTKETDEYIKIEAGIYEIGFAGDGFHFDNELGRHRVFLGDYAVAQNLVTNGEFLEFIEEGGYRNFNLWHSEGWDWVNQNQVEAPLYWERDENSEWLQFTLGGLRPIKKDAPVCHVSFYEAFAYAEWKGLRLPTEFEWEAAADRFDWGLRWEWTHSAYLPYPKFKKPAGAVGEYNGKFMINQMVLRGASAVTPAGHSRRTYRNFFHPHLRWQFTGIRLARS